MGILNKKNLIPLGIGGRAVLLTMILCVLFTGCVGSDHSKVVIIKDENNEDQIDSEINGDFNIKKIYKYQSEQNDEQINRTNIGWADQDNIITIKNRKELNKIDYRYRFTHPIVNENPVILGVLSPDGTKLSYVTEDEDDVRFYLLNIGTEKTQCIYHYKSNFSPYSILKWSAQGRFVSFTLQKNSENYLFVYDTDSVSLREIKIITKNPIDYFFLEAVVSEDGKQVSLFYFLNQFYYLYPLNLQNQEITINDADAGKVTNNLSGRYSLQKNSLIYLDNSNTLCKYDHRIKKVIKIAENMYDFEISQNSMYIAYTEVSMKSSDIYVGKLTDKGIDNKKLIYKGMNPYSMKWSPDNKKILLEGYDDNNYPGIRTKDKRPDFNNGKYTIIVEFEE